MLINVNPIVIKHRLCRTQVNKYKRPIKNIADILLSLLMPYFDL
jgi:hypothetical protein